MIKFLMGNILYVLLAVGVVFNLFWLGGNRSKLKMNTAGVVLFSVIHTVVGVLFVKTFAFLESGTFNGMSIFGAVFFMPLAYFLGAKLFKRNIADVFDVFTVCMVFTLLLARLNCIFAGCCLGLPIPFIEGARWPTREAEIVLYIAFLVLFANKATKKVSTGVLYPIYMIWYGMFRFAVEWLREVKYYVGIFHISHIWAILSTVVGVCIYLYITKKNKGNSKKIKKKALK